MTFIVDAKLKRKTNFDRWDPMCDRIGEFLSVKEAASLPSGPLPYHPNIAHVFVTSVPDKFREGWLDMADGGLTFQVGEIVTNLDGATGEVTHVHEERLILKSIVGDFSRSGAITGDRGGSGFHNRHQIVLQTIHDWLKEPNIHSVTGEKISYSRRFICLSDIPNNKKRDLRDQGWTSAKFNQVKNFIKRRPLDVHLTNKDDATLDAEAIADEGAPS